MLTKFIGPGLVMVFCISQAFRDVYFANAFQGVDFFFIILLAFSIATVVFGAVAVICKPDELVRMRGEIPALVWMNLLTALAWTSYFFSLKYLQPSIVNTLHSGAGPLTVVVLAAFGIHIARPSPMRRIEHICYLGIAASLLFLCWVVLADRSGLQSENLLVTVVGLVLPIVSGTAITVSSLWAKRLNERGIGADTVTAGRYILIVTIALVVVIAGDRPPEFATAGEFAALALATTILIVLPLYSLQLGIARTAPLTAHTIRSLGPVLVFGLELVDGRIAYSGSTLSGIALYSFFALGSNLVRGWQDDTVHNKLALASRNEARARHPCANSQ
jgi:drug/metabolite transporter (DMT)-like permease